MEQLKVVNLFFNKQVRYVEDIDLWHEVDYWETPIEALWKGAGDCEDYALLKRKMLMDKGVDASDLLLTVVLQPNGEGHAVLTVRTDHGDFVLDNMTNRVLGWNQTGYTFLRMQDPRNPQQWVATMAGGILPVEGS